MHTVATVCPVFRSLVTRALVTPLDSLSSLTPHSHRSEKNKSSFEFPWTTLRNRICLSSELGAWPGTGSPRVAVAGGLVPSNASPHAARASRGARHGPPRTALAARASRRLSSRGETAGQRGNRTERARERERESNDPAPADRGLASAAWLSCSNSSPRWRRIRPRPSAECRRRPFGRAP